MNHFNLQILPSTDAVLKEQLNDETKENAINSIKQSTYGKLKYNITGLLASEFQKTLRIIPKSAQENDYNSFEFVKNHQTDEIDEQAKQVNQKSILDVNALDELILDKKRHDVNKYLKQLNQNDVKKLEEKHREHVKMFEKFNPVSSKPQRKSANIVKKQLDADLALNESVSPVKQQLEENIVNYELINERIKFNEKYLGDILNGLKGCMSQMEMIGVNLFDKTLVDKCKSSIYTFNILVQDNPVVENLRILKIVSPETYGKNAELFLNTQKKLCDDEQLTIDQLNRDIIRVKNELEMKKRKFYEDFMRDINEISVKCAQYLNIFKSLFKLLESIDEKHEKYEQIFASLNKFMSDIEMIQNNVKILLNNKNLSENEMRNELNKYRSEKDRLYANVKDYETKINEEIRKKTIIEQQQKLVEAKTVEKIEIKAAEQVKSTLIPIGITSHAFQFYTNLTDSLKKLQLEFEAVFSENQQMKNYKFDLQKAINFPLNSLLDDESNTDNKRNFHDKIKTLLRLLSGQTCVITSTLTVNPTKHPKGIEFCMEYLASKIIIKGEESVSSRPDTAFQYAQLSAVLIKQFPNFENILLAEFYTKCPYTTPYYKQREKNQSVEDYFRILGYKIDDTGKVEEDEYFYKRMNGILMLYFTLLLNQDYKNGIDLAWKWLSDVLNMKPHVNITASMLTVFFKCCGYQLQKIYANQFKKLVNYCIQLYMPIIHKLGEHQNKAQIGRLELILNEYKQNGYFSEWKK